MLGFLLYMPLHHAMSLDVQVRPLSIAASTPTRCPCLLFELPSLQVLWPQIVTLGIMGASVVLTLKDSVPGNAFMAVILSSQFVLGITNATIAGGVYHMASWLPASYIQALPCTPCDGGPASSSAEQTCLPCSLQGMSLGIGLSGTAVSAISFLTLWGVPRGPGPPSPAQVAPAAFAYFLGELPHPLYCCASPVFMTCFGHA